MIKPAEMSLRCNNSVLIQISVDSVMSEKDNLGDSLIDCSSYL